MDGQRSEKGGGWAKSMPLGAGCHFSLLRTKQLPTLSKGRVCATSQFHHRDMAPFWGGLAACQVLLESASKQAVAE